MYAVNEESRNRSLTRGTLAIKMSINLPWSQGVRAKLATVANVHGLGGDLEQAAREFEAIQQANPDLHITAEFTTRTMFFSR